MSHQIRFPIKGCFYYDAFFASEQQLLATDRSLIMTAEPDNQHDRYALQVWLSLATEQTTKTADSRLLIGYIPRVISQQLNGYFQHYTATQLSICHFAQKGRLIEIDCLIDIEHPLYFGYRLIWLKALAQFSITLEYIKRKQRRFWYKLSAE